MATGLSTDERVRMIALELFGSQGYAATSMEEVRRQAEISNGSLYYLYPSKPALAARLYCDGMVQSQDGIINALEATDDAQEGVRGAVVFQTGWVESHVELARLVYSDWTDDVLVAAVPSLDGPNRHYVRVVERWLRDRVAAGDVIDRPFPVLHALWLGPTQEYCRHWLRGRSRLRPRRVANDLAGGAWRALARETP
jgi:AcrR family transcriptional regulator